jgi:DNA modification methylase
MSFLIHQGDCLAVLKNCLHEQYDSCVTDPPYGLEFMGKSWDYDVPSVEIWREVYRVLKPGAHLLAFFGSRTYHRGVVQIEDAGFEIRDQIMWLYGSGFPKSHDVSKGIDKAAGVDFEARPASGVGFMGPDGPGGYNVTKNQLSRKGESTPEAKQWEGWGTALKPAQEPIVLARKPLGEKTVAANVLKYGTGALNIDASRVVEGGRWPANVIHDGSGGSAARFFYCAKASKHDRDEGLENFEAKWQAGAEFRPNHMEKAQEGSTGNPYGRWDPRKNNHPTVKPTELMRYLCTLVTPPGGTVLDPFAGSGSTGKGAAREDFHFVGIEKDPDYFKIMQARLTHAYDKGIMKYVRSAKGDTSVG